MNPKQRAAEAALNYVRSGMVLGLGTGSTADCFLQALAAALRCGLLENVRGIPTSVRSEQRARQLGISLCTLGQVCAVDLTIDGADEVAPNLDLIKGLGGALLREKIVAQHSRRLIIIADASKRVSVLGTRCPLPVEVAPFGHECHEEYLRSLGADVRLRRTPEGSPAMTDNGNYIYDCRFERIVHPAALEARLSQRAGVICSGLFLGMAELAIVADDSRVEVIERRQ